MATTQEHCMESLLAFGKPFKEVHRWLDQFAGKPSYGMRHRHLRHHEAGIREAMHLFGPDAGAAARQQIITDLKQERLPSIYTRTGSSSQSIGFCDLWSFLERPES